MNKTTQLQEPRTKEQEEFLQWLQNPVSQQLRQWAQRKRQALMESWANGQFSDGFDVAMAVKNAGATGACSAYLEVMEVNFETLNEELDDGREHEWPHPEGASGVDRTV